MRDFQTPRTFILSAYRATADETVNRRAHCDLAADLALDGVPFREAQGYFEGNTEECFVVTGGYAERVVRLLARHFKQDSFLVIAEHDRTAYLVDTDTGYHTHLGKLVNVGGDKPDAVAWTCVDGDYFTTDGRPGADLPGGL
jgi:hypothetical protein